MQNDFCNTIEGKADTPRRFGGPPIAARTDVALHCAIGELAIDPEKDPYLEVGAERRLFCSNQRVT